MESDDDFLPATQFTQQQGSSQAVSSTSRARDMPGPSRSGAGPSRSGRGPSQSGSGARRPQGSQSGSGARRPQGSQGPSQVELSQLQDGLKFLMDRIEQFSGDSKVTKRPEQKPYDTKPALTKEGCHLCKKLFANKTTLFRHYRAMHQEMNPEKYHGCSVNSTVVSLDVTVENTCGICGYVGASQNALASHNRDVHSNDTDVSVRPCSTSVNYDNDHRPDVANKENVNNIGNVINRLHKCEECACYFEERNKLDDHMKVQHGFEVVCKICNKNLLFKDVDDHVKNSHSDVYKKNNKVEKVLVEKIMKNKKGDRVRVFICNKCELKMVDKMEAEKHARGHKKGFKIKVATRRNKTKVKENLIEVASNDHIILTCNTCDISTGDYDTAVEHSQNHITNNLNYTVTQQCLICELKFEPLCYKKHIDLHYNNKEIHKESFKYFKYRFQLLLTENWFDCFMGDPAIKDMISRSIYNVTRNVKMRVMNEGAYILYRCCQCDNFVGATAVLNHTMNYDTCVKVKCSYTCELCKRRFNNRLARDKHAQDHNSEESYKTVLFNHKNDKEFNKVLNDPNVRLNYEQNSEEGIINNNANTPKVLYKCLCGLCFVLKDSVDSHKRICPGKDPRKPCPKCDNMFNPDELLVHCFQHHLNDTVFVIESFSPDVIVIDSDEESQNCIDDNHDFIEIDDSEEKDAQTERFQNIKMELLKTYDGTTVEAERQNLAPKIAVSDAGNIEHAASTNTSFIAKTEEDNEDDDEGRCNNSFEGDSEEREKEMRADGPQDTVTYENMETVTDVECPASDINERNQLKLVSPDLLINPLYLQNALLNGNDIRVLNAKISAGIESVRQQVETTGSLNRVCVNDTAHTAIKQEQTSSVPTDSYISISSRLSWKQRQHHPNSNSSQEIVESLLTDDEETETQDGIISAGSSSVNNTLLLNPLSHHNVLANENGVLDTEITAVNEAVRQQVETTNLLNSVTFNDRAIKQEQSSSDFTGSYIHSRLSWKHRQNRPNSNCSQEIVESLLTDDEETETQDGIISAGSSSVNNLLLNPLRYHNVVTNGNNTCVGNAEITAGTEAVRQQNIQNDTQIEFANGDQGMDIDESREEPVSNENNEPDYSDIEDDLFVPSGIESSDKSRNMELNDNAKEITENINSNEEPMVAQIDIASNKTHSRNSIEESELRIDNFPVQNTTRDEIPQDGVEINEIRPDETYGTLNTDTNQTRFDRVTNVSSEHVISNHGKLTQHFVEATPLKPAANITQIAETTNTSSESSETQRVATIKKRVSCMNINIKKELIDIIQEAQNGCEEIRIKTEPKDEEENKENDVFVMKNADVNYQHCSIS